MSGPRSSSRTAPLDRRRATAYLVCATGTLVLACVLGALLGAEPISVARAIFDPQSLDRTLVLDVRLPRVLLAALAGGGLAAVGSAFQALLRNPLAEPYVLGVSGGSALGATIAIALGITATGFLGAVVVPGAALLGGLGATLLVYGIASETRAGTQGASILLAGVMVNSISSALISFIKSFVTPSRAQELMRWLTGFIDLPTPLALGTVLVYVTIGSVFLLFDAARLNLLALGDETAETLGVDVRALERRVFLASSCVVGAVVSQTGLIGFVGLVVPHALRSLVGPDHRIVLPLSLLLGGAGVVACDLVARMAFRVLGNALPVGAVTALIGGPLFLWLLKRSGRFSF